MSGIGVFGAGGVGGYFGGLLANAGEEVSFIARGAHLHAIRDNGLRILSVNGDFHIEVRASDDPREIGPVDTLIVALKDYQLTDSMSSMAPLVTDNTLIVPLLNGVEAHDTLQEGLGRGHIVGGLARIVSYIESPGVIRQESKIRQIIVGELDRQPSDRLQTLVDIWIGTGAEAIQAGDIFVEIWTKFVFIASFGGVSSLARANAGAVIGTHPTRALYVEAMREIEAVARSQGIDLARDVVDRALALTERVEATTTSSMQRDVAAGKPFELEAFSGAVRRYGEKASVPTPVHDTIYALLLPALESAIRH